MTRTESFSNPLRYPDPCDKDEWFKFWELMRAQDIEVMIIDIDGTVTKEYEGWGEEIYAARTPSMDMVEHVRGLHKRSDTLVFFWTARRPEDEDVTLAWMEKFNVPFDAIFYGKPHWTILVDDKVQDVDSYIGRSST